MLPGIPSMSMKRGTEETDKSGIRRCFFTMNTDPDGSFE